MASHYVLASTALPSGDATFEVVMAQRVFVVLAVMTAICMLPFLMVAFVMMTALAIAGHCGLRFLHARANCKSTPCALVAACRQLYIELFSQAPDESCQVSGRDAHNRCCRQGWCLYLTSWQFRTFRCSTPTAKTPCKVRCLRALINPVNTPAANWRPCPSVCLSASTQTM